MKRYFSDIYHGIRSSAIGMGITLRYMCRKSVTVQYPYEPVTVAPGYRGLHHLNLDICIACGLCAAACPVNCIEQEFQRVDKENVLVPVFKIDYNKCLFCWYCIPVCPTECICMGEEFELSTYDRQSLDYDLVAKGQTSPTRDMELFREEFGAAIEALREKKPEKAEAADPLFADPRVGIAGRNPSKDKSPSSGYSEVTAS